jgi:hypothetical protein
MKRNIKDFKNFNEGFVDDIVSGAKTSWQRNITGTYKEPVWIWIKYYGAKNSYYEHSFLKNDGVGSQVNDLLMDIMDDKFSLNFTKKGGRYVGTYFEFDYSKLDGVSKFLTGLGLERQDFERGNRAKDIVFRGKLSKRDLRGVDKLTEAIVDWETPNIQNFKIQTEEELSNKGILTFDDIYKIGLDNDVEVVNYETFIDDLPTEKMKADAPPKGIPAFGLVNPVTHKARLVLNTDRINKSLLNFINHVLKHENVHVGQKMRKIDKSSGEYLGDVKNTKAYFSNKDEIMAFAQSVSDMVMDMNPRDINHAVKMITKTPLWRPISTLDEKTVKRYKKYIYLYLEREFQKKSELKENLNSK